MSSPQLLAVLERAQTLGHIGSGSIQDFVGHARAHISAARPALDTQWCDLGSGGGLPGLVVAVERPDLNLTLIDRSSSRTAFLDEAVTYLEVAPKVKVVNGDATELAHKNTFRGVFDGVFSRSFGPPAATAECAIAFLANDGQLVVSEPPNEDPSRWPMKELKSLGYAELEIVDGPPRFARLISAIQPDSEVPRSWKHITKRPLF